MVFRPLNVRNVSLQPLWSWLVLLAGICLFFDVAVRRIAVDPAAVAARVQQVWERLRGRATAAAGAPQFLERLKSRKAQVDEGLGKGRAARRFEAEGAPAAPTAGGEIPVAAPRPQTPRPVPPSQVGPEKEQEPQDYASRLLRAKRRAMEEREKENES